MQQLAVIAAARAHKRIPIAVQRVAQNEFSFFVVSASYRFSGWPVSWLTAHINQAFLSASRWDEEGYSHQLQPAQMRTDLSKWIDAFLRWHVGSKA
ncbi:MAG: hypothetical protein EBY45_09830 [Gammaproteobacteria bacterium]|nr:hypothetical protein [Gammaproteobacteria bacterium]